MEVLTSNMVTFVALRCVIFTVHINCKKNTGINIEIKLVGDKTDPVGQGLLIHEVSRSHTTTHHS